MTKKILSYMCIALVMLLSAVMGKNPVHGYGQREGSGHDLITRQAIQILRNDGFREIADAVTANYDDLFTGINRADNKYGRVNIDLVVYEADWNLAGNTHYYNPDAPESVSGLRVGILNSMPDWVIYLLFGWTDDENKVFALRGPQPSAKRLADWYYALAVKAMREGHTQAAYQNLGEAIHMVQDLTIPQHATDCYGLPHHQHQVYESWADQIAGRYSATNSCYMSIGLPVSQYAEAAAMASAERIDEVTGFEAVSAQEFEPVMEDLLLLAQQQTAAILVKFHQQWDTEPYSAVKLTVHSAEALNAADGWAADLFVALNVFELDEPRGYWEYRDDFFYDDFVSGYFGDEDRVTPGEYLGYDVWTFPYTSEGVRRSEEIWMVLGLFDDDSPYTPDTLDISRHGDVRRAYLKVNLRTGEIQNWDLLRGVYDVLYPVGQRNTLIGNDDSTWEWDEGGRGRIEFTIDGVYLPAREPTPQPPHRPQNISPGTWEAMDTGVTLTPILYATSYSDPDGSPQAGSQWMLGDMYGTVVFNRSGGPRTSWQVTSNLTPATRYGWQVRYQESTGLWSDWSQMTFFTTTMPPQQPVNVSPPHGATGVDVKPLLLASDYSDPEGQPHIASEWKVSLPRRIETGGSSGGIVYFETKYQQSSDGSTSHRLGISLSGNTTYVWEVRYQDVCGAWSEWSQKTSFTTLPQLTPVPPPPLTPVGS